LKINASNENGFPWDYETIDENIMERSYISYLVNNSDKLSVFTNNIFSLPDITIQSIVIGVLSNDQIKGIII
jgi:hypothetical protein